MNDPTSEEMTPDLCAAKIFEISGEKFAPEVAAEVCGDLLFQEGGPAALQGCGVGQLAGLLVFAPLSEDGVEEVAEAAAGEFAAEGLDGFPAENPGEEEAGGASEVDAQG